MWCDNSSARFSPLVHHQQAPCFSVHAINSCTSAPAVGQTTKPHCKTGFHCPNPSAIAKRWAKWQQRIWVKRTTLFYESSLGSSGSLICTRPQNRWTCCRLGQQPVASVSSLYVFYPRIENSNHSCIFMHLPHTAIDLSPLPAEEACKQILQPSNPCWRYPRLVLFQLTNKLLLVEDLNVKGCPNNSTTNWYALMFRTCEL